MNDNTKRLIADEKFVEWMKDSFVSNECGTDEYRETQPAKGLGYVYEAASCNEGTGGDEGRALDRTLLTLTETWIKAMLKGEGSPYAGSEACEPLMAFVFDQLWANHQHPYTGGWEEDSFDEYMREQQEFYSEEVA
jgi:hypothetical protein